jgi:hypothetical protein
VSLTILWKGIGRLGFFGILKRRRWMLEEVSSLADRGVEGYHSILARF